MLIGILVNANDLSFAKVCVGVNLNCTFLDFFDHIYFKGDSITVEISSTYIVLFLILLITFTLKVILLPWG